MSFMTTTMSVLPIWGSDGRDAELRLARLAGWRRSDLVWERLMERGLSEERAGDLRRADWLARILFPRGDPRRATAAAARARRAFEAGNTARATALRHRALREFEAVEDFIAGLQIAPRARSSLFHLRMEARHRETYHDNLRLRFSKIAAETRAHLEALTSGARPSPPALFAMAGRETHRLRRHPQAVGSLPPDPGLRVIFHWRFGAASALIAPHETDTARCPRVCRS